MTTLPHADLPHDPRILRTLADQNRLDLGDPPLCDGSAGQPGARRGDTGDHLVHGGLSDVSFSVSIAYPG